MCGICGEVRFDGEKASLATVERMMDRLERRGPDSAGAFQQWSVAVGHRRLKIIDISERAQQPMFDPSLGIGVVFNGAIYNFPELKEELKSQGYRFYSDGDTEVIIKAYHYWGESFVSRLKGMFAFALWERDTGKTLMARDRQGIKPLYYSQFSWGLRFASNLQALLTAGDISHELDPVALHHYMTFHSVVPAPHTILKDIRKLPPATAMVRQPGEPTRQWEYWTLTFSEGDESSRVPEAQWEEATREALFTSVKRRLIADVPVGVLLSGGLDSSLVVGLLAEAGQKNISTFSIGFEAVGAEKGDEFQYSDVIAQHYGTDHHKIVVKSDELIPSLRECVAAMSEPMVSHDVIGFYLLSKEVARHVKVVQSGQGADEVFAGYHWYPKLQGSQDPVSDYAKAFFDRPHGEYREAVNSAYVDEDYSLQYVREHFGRPGAENGVNKALRLDTTTMLVDDPVKRVDNMTMAWGLEARVPFLDHELVELAARMPPEMKLAQGGKGVLKSVARKIIPHEVIDRPKGYFPVPALKYIQGPYLEFVKDILGQPAAKRRGLFQEDYVNKLLADPESHITPLRGSKLWQVALLEYWLQIHEIG